MLASPLDGLTLDQIRMFVAIADEGSFSAAARRLHRVQSAVSHAMSTFEGLLGVNVWNRTTRVPHLTSEGEALLQHARRILAAVDHMRRTATGFAGGLEGAVSLCVDQLFPTASLVELCQRFAVAFPDVSLTVHSETLHAVSERVLTGNAQLGVIGPAAASSALLSSHVVNVRMVPCVARGHPLAARHGRVTTEALSRHVQIVLSERSEKGVSDQAVLSPRTWRIADLATKMALIQAGLGWGNLPRHMLAGAAARRIVRIYPEAWAPQGFLLPLSLVSLPGLIRGPATRWLANAIPAACRIQPDSRRRNLWPRRRPVPDSQKSL